MSVPSTNPQPADRPLGVAPRRDARRAKFAVYSVVLVVTTLVIVALANFLAGRFSYRLDVTAGGDQQLAPRTIQILASLRGPHQIVIAAPLRTFDRRVLQRVKDTLRDFEQQAPDLSTSFIDTSNAGGREQYLQFVASLISRERAKLDAQTESVRAGAQTLGVFASFLGSDLSTRLLSIRDAMVGDSQAKAGYRQFFEQTAAAARLSAQDLEAARQRAVEALELKIDDISLPATDTASKELARVIEPTAAELDLLIKQLRNAQLQPELAPPLVLQIRTLADDLQKRRDAAAVLADEMARLPRLDVVRVIETLKGGSACLIIGPNEGGLTAIDIESLIPNAASVAAASMSGVDIGRRGEDLFSVALGSLSAREKPIVVIVHAEAGRVFETTPVVKQLWRRLSMRGIDLVEWACAIQDQPPGLARLNPDNKRPVVYVSVAPNSAVGGDSKGQLTGPQRAEKLGQALDALANEGKNLLVGVFPSVLPTTGNVDPTVRVLGRFGLMAYSGRTLLRDALTSQGRLVDSDFEVQPTGGDHPIGKAIQGLPMLISWPIDIANVGEANPKVRTWSLVTIAPKEGVWAESQWLKFWSMPAEGRAQMPDAPVFDRNRDLAKPDVQQGQPARAWTIGVAAEIDAPAGAKQSQRLIALGANGWFIDRFAFRTSAVDGRPVVAYPGNLELFEAGITWLAHQDEMIAQSPAARLLPVVKSMSRGQLLLAQWGFIAGLPILTLLVGLLHRWLRG